MPKVICDSHFGKRYLAELKDRGPTRLEGNKPRPVPLGGTDYTTVRAVSVVGFTVCARTFDIMRV